MDLSKLTTSDKVIAGSGILLFIASFLPWFTASVFGYHVTANGWDTGFLWGGIPSLLGLASAAIVIATKPGSVEMPKMSISTGQAMLIAGAVAAALVVLKLLIGDHGISRGFGLYLATLASLALLGGGYLAFQEDKPS